MNEYAHFTALKVLAPHITQWGLGLIQRPKYGDHPQIGGEFQRQPMELVVNQASAAVCGDGGGSGGGRGVRLGFVFARGQRNLGLSKFFFGLGCSFGFSRSFGFGRTFGFRRGPTVRIVSLSGER